MNRPRGRYSLRAYQGERVRGEQAGACEGDGPPCDHQHGACDIRELWPYDGETDQQSVARLKAKYNGAAPVQEAQTHEQ